jgi:hypothetical protein
MVPLVARSFPQDVSRLVDVCRQSIVYASLADLAAGLDAIASDPAVRLVRVKNRLSPSYSAAQSAGCHSHPGDPSLMWQACAGTPPRAGLAACALQVRARPRSHALKQRLPARWVGAGSALSQPIPKGRVHQAALALVKPGP